jgi:hypothetical protein
MSRIGYLKKNCKKATPGTTINVLMSCADAVANVPKTVYELGQAANGYVRAQGDKVRYGEPFLMVGGEKFTKHRAIVDTGKVSFETAGDAFFEAIKNMGSFEILNATEDGVREVVEDINDCGCGHVVMFEMPSGDYAVLGNANHPASVKAKGESGSKAGDKNVATVDIEDTTGKVWRTYPKALALDVYPELV